MRWVRPEVLSPAGDDAMMDAADAGRPLPASVLLEMAAQVALGMQGLGGLGIVHRDLAARNVLVFRLDPADEAETLVKVADFGLTRETAVYYDGPHTTALPVRYMPPEALERKRFSAASDVWAFGVLVWELFSGCAFPYADEVDDDADLRAHLRAGHRLPRPDTCPVDVHETILLRCWAAVPADRPSFAELVRLLREAERS